MSGVNFYAYVSNRPTDLIDPSGLLPKPTTPYRWVPCNAAESAECRSICGARGMQSCRASETWRLIRYKDGFTVTGWKRGPMSCSCNEECEKQPQEHPFRIPLIDPLADWLNEKLRYPFKGPGWDKVRDWQREFERGPRPIPGWGPVPGPVPVPAPVPWWQWLFTH